MNEKGNPNDDGEAVQITVEPASVLARMAETIASAISRKERDITSAADYFARHAEAIRMGSEAWTRQLDELRLGAIEIAKAFKELPDSHLTLLKNGWHIPFDFVTSIGEVNNLAKRLQNGDEAVVDTEFIKHFDHQFHKMSNRLCKQYPHRRKVLSAALEAHKEGRYFLSIPVFFAQTEGICLEITGIRLFKARKGKLASRLWAQERAKSGSIKYLLLQPLMEMSPMTLEQRHVKDSRFEGINRHFVLHGENYEYGDSKVNSYKALSQLSYVGLTIPQVLR
jgi:hypothetical protein